MLYYRCDRSRTCGGGVCIIINSDVCQFKSTSSKVAFDNFIAQAIICVDNYHVINIICCYLPPKTGFVQNDLLRNNSFFYDISSKLDKKLPNYIVGDFNLRDINWTNPCTFGNRPEQCFINFILANHFEQFVSEPTRVGFLLDLIFADCRDSIHDISVIDPFSTSNHYSIKFSLLFHQASSLINRNASQLSNVKLKFNFAAADWQAFNAALSLVNWFPLLSRAAFISTAWSSFYSILHNIMINHIPVRPSASSTGHIATKSCYPSFIRKLRTAKLNAWRLFKSQSGNINLRDACKASASAFDAASREWHRNRELKFITSASQSSFYRYISSLLKTSHRSTLLINSSGDVLSNPSGIANEFINYFSSVFSIDNGLLVTTGISHALCR